MRLGNYLRLFSALIVLLIWHSPASATIIYWTTNLTGHTQFPSAPAAIAGMEVASGGLSRFEITGKFPTYWSFEIYRVKDGSFGGYATITKYGNECPANTQYNPETGECAAPEAPCADKAGVEEGFSKAGTAPDGFGFISSSGMFGTQRQGCKGGCATEIVDVRLQGKVKVSGAYYVRGTAVYTGQQCATTGTGDQIDEDTNDSTDPETVKEEVPCVYSTVGGKQVCESKKSEETEGRHCGTVNGVQTCVPTAPAKNGVDIRTEVTTETHADGSTTTTKKDTATATTCKGINNCTTKTATTTTTTKKNANGSTTSVGSTCTGSACPNKTTDPDGDGDGLGDCAAGTGTQCGSGTGGPGGGEGQDWYTPGDDTFESVLTQFAAAVKQTPIASQTTNFLTFRASGGCPRWSVSVWVFDIDIDQLCSGDIPWAAIRAVILAAAAFLSFRIALF